MKPYLINLINALVLIILGLTGYLVSENPSVTAFIPVFAGIVLLLLVKGMKNNNKTIAHIVVFLTLLILIALYKPLSGALLRNDIGATIRVAAMIGSNLLALVIFVKSFIDARRK